jgi:uncharacterized membrane protein YhaH (DUF805 family)
MNFFEAIKSVLTKYVQFSGRSPRSEYWYWVLFVVIVSIALRTLDGAIFEDMEQGPLQAVFGILTFLPALGVGIRRLHDIDRSGWWTLIVLTIIGIIPLIYWACLKGTDGPNRFGPDPLAGRV